MIKIENKQTELFISQNEDGTPKFAGITTLIDTCLKRNPPTGLGIEEMRQRFKILDIIEASKGSDIEVTPEQLKHIKDAVKVFKWAQAHKDVIMFGDYIEGLK